MIEPILSVCVVTYNHEKYIAQALDSFLMQKTDFDFQIIVGDDASTDRTPEILKEYQAKYPDKIKLILHPKNVTPIHNSLSVYDAARTEYVAICDGDDYWTDNTKLQQQVNILQRNKSLSICFHLTKVIFENVLLPPQIYPSKETRPSENVFTIDVFALNNPIHTSSLVYRWRFKDGGVRDLMPDNICPGDYFLGLLHAELGDIVFLDKVMSVYRRNNGGISAGLELHKDQTWLALGEMQLNFFRAVDRHFSYRFTAKMRKNCKDLCKDILDAYIKNNATDKLEKFKNTYPEYYWLAMSLKEEEEAEYDKVKMGKLLSLSKKINRSIKRIFFITVVTFIAVVYLLIKDFIK